MLLAGGGSLLLVFLSQFTRTPVLLLGSLATVSRLGYYAEYGVAGQGQAWVLQLGNWIGSLGGTVPATCKILMAGIASPDQLGKLNTWVAVLESLIPLALVPVFDTVWRLTGKTWPGADFLITAGLLIIILALFAVVAMLRRK